MNGEFNEIWVYLSASPLLALTLTLSAYQVSLWLYNKAGKNPLLNPVLISVCFIVSMLTLFQTSYATYFEGAQFVHFLLGPATVALAVPLYRQLHLVKSSMLGILVAIICGSATAAITAVAVGWVLGASEITLLSLAPKSATTPVAMGISEQIGGLPSLTAVAVIITGILGAMIGSTIFSLFNIKDQRAQGISLGVTSHGIGTAQALQMNSLTGAFSGLAMGLNAIATAVLIPLLVRMFY